jgi:hypothetical protein
MEYVLTECFANLVGDLKIFDTDSASCFSFLFIRYGYKGSFKCKTLDVLKPILTKFCLLINLVIGTPLVQSLENSILGHLD